MFSVCSFHFMVFLSLTYESFAVLSSETPPTLLQLNYCLINQASKPNLRECIGRSALSFLQNIEEHENYTLTQGFVAAKDDKIAGRSLVNFLDTDPVDFRGILENAGAVFSQRSLEFHMDTVYPGLMFKIGPSADTNSVAEFVIDPTVDERNFVSPSEQPSTARILAKQYFLPFLLGLKFNLVALVPLLFAGICLLLKKSLFLAKFAIYVSSLLGVGGALGTLGTLGGILGGVGGGAGINHVPGHSLGGNYAGFPTKIGLHNTINQYDEYDFHQNSPYKRSTDRTDRKIKFDEPRDLVSRSFLPLQSDRFYDFNKELPSENFIPSEELSSDWKVIEMES